MHLDYHQSANKLRAGTHGRGVYEIQIHYNHFRCTVTFTRSYRKSVVSNSTIIPAGKVRNNSPGSATFTVTRKINPGSYSSTKTISNLT
ncbi:MAG: hypothetical protein IPI04_04460 [Ignavibacteria bacterium]|nr:hypothetical protein [Ignavibacteria bacterium]